MLRPLERLGKSASLPPLPYFAYIREVGFFREGHFIVLSKILLEREVKF